MSPQEITVYLLVFTFLYGVGRVIVTIIRALLNDRVIDLEEQGSIRSAIDDAVNVLREDPPSGDQDNGQATHHQPKQ